MLLNDAQIALNDIIVNCKDAADHYDDAACMLEEHHATAELLRELARSRRKIASDLEDHIRALGGLPRDADGDRETISRLLARLKATLSEDKRVALLTEREHVEGELAAMTETGLRQDLPRDTRDYLSQLKSRFADAQRRLAEAKESA